MKKPFCVLLACALGAPLLFASEKSADGWASVADTGVFPAGDYAKAAGYLPGARVSVTNPAAKITADVLILGAPDAGEGISILLSPEAAKKLAIQKGSPARVSLTKRSGWSERAVRTAGEPRPGTDSKNAPPAEPRQRQAADSLDWQAARNAETDKPDGDAARRSIVSAAEPNRRCRAERGVEETRVNDAASDNRIGAYPSDSVAVPEPEIVSGGDAPGAAARQRAEACPKQNAPPDALAPNLPAVIPPPQLTEKRDAAANALSTDTKTAKSSAPRTEPERRGKAAAGTGSGFSELAANTLKSGAYYVQIAALTNEGTIRNILAAYDEAYPMALAEIASKTYRVLVGPLTADECGVVLARFRNKGYADAFLRNID
jgi:hypothetical protein